MIGGWRHTLACGIGSVTGDLILFSLVLLGGHYLFSDLSNPMLQSVLAAIGVIVLLPLGIYFLVHALKEPLRAYANARQHWDEGTVPAHLVAEVADGTALTLLNPLTIVARRSPAYWRVTIDNSPINVMGPEMVRQFQEVIDALEADEHVRVVVFDSAVEDYFLNHSDFTAKLEDLTGMPAGPTGLPPWPDFLVRLTRLPVASIALIRGRATGNGSEIALACDMSFASREKAIISQWEVGVGMVAGGGPMARLPRLIGRNRALEVLLSSEDIRAEQAEAYGYINRALPDAGARRVRGGARDPDRRIRQVGDRQHETTPNCALGRRPTRFSTPGS
ncbi:MAG: LysE family transporter [Terriglobales bacterium]